MSKGTFSDEVRECMSIVNGGYCMCHPDCQERANEFHHILPNTKPNQRAYPLYLHSPMNCCPISHDCHMTKPLPKPPTLIEVIGYELYLSELQNG